MRVKPVYARAREKNEDDDGERGRQAVDDKDRVAGDMVKVT